MCNTNHRLCCLYSCPQSKVNLMVFFCDVLQLADQFCNSVGILQQTAQPGNVFSGFEKSKFFLLDRRIALRCRIAENP